MQVFLSALAHTADIALLVLVWALFIRAILSWFISNPENKLVFFLVVLTEPFVIPVRILLSRIEALQRLPVDLSLLVTSLLLDVIRVVLSIFSTMILY